MAMMAPWDDISGCFLRLKNLTITEVHTRCDIAYPEEYVKENMVPRSLRWEVNPQKEDSEIAKWFKYFNEAGVNFLKFLIPKKTRKLTLKTILIKEESEQKTKKKRKYNRYKGLQG